MRVCIILNAEILPHTKNMTLGHKHVHRKPMFWYLKLRLPRITEFYQGSLVCSFTHN